MRGSGWCDTIYINEGDHLTKRFIRFYVVILIILGLMGLLIWQSVRIRCWSESRQATRRFLANMTDLSTQSELNRSEIFGAYYEACLNRKNGS